MTSVASLIRGVSATVFAGESAERHSRRFVLLIGAGTGPKVAFRARKAWLRVRGLAESGRVLLDVDGQETEFRSNGDHPILGGEFAKVVEATNPVICELLV